MLTAQPLNYRRDDRLVLGLWTSFAGLNILVVLHHDVEDLVSDLSNVNQIVDDQPRIKPGDLRLKIALELLQAM